MIDRLAQVILSVGTVSIPWLVVVVALARAKALARSGGSQLTTPRTARWLAFTTIASCFAFIVVAWWFRASSREFSVSLVATVTALLGLGWFALRDVGDAVNDLREVDASVRQAALKRRRVSEYLPVAWRFVPMAVATAGLLVGAWRITLPLPGRRLWLPVIFAVAALIFAWLYDAWIKQEVLGGQIDGAPGSPHDLPRTVRRIFAWECALAAGFVAASHLLLSANWTQQSLGPTVIIVATGVLGTVGCALILAHEIVRTKYRTTNHA